MSRPNSRRQLYFHLPRALSPLRSCPGVLLAPRCPPVRKRAPLTPSSGGDERPGVGPRHISFINCLCRTWGNLGPRSLPLKERTKAERRILRTAAAAEASRSWERASARAPSPHSRKPPCVDGGIRVPRPPAGDPGLLFSSARGCCVERPVIKARSG